MIKLTKKQYEIVTKVKKIEEETGKTVYLMYNRRSNKIHATTMILDKNGVIKTAENRGILCTRNVSEIMKSKNIIVPEVAGKHKLYIDEDKLYDYTLCKVNFEGIGV